MSGPALVRQPIRKRFLTTSPCTKCRLGRASLCSWMGYKVRGAQDEFTLAAIAQNLRRLAKLVVRPSPAVVLCAA